MGTHSLASSLIAELDGPGLAFRARYRVKNLAQQLGLKPRTLRTRWAQMHGGTPKKWLNQMRMQQCEALLMAGANAREIARRLFYKDAAHFCHDFRKHHGMTPYQWRKQQRARQRSTRTPARTQPATEAAKQRPG